MKGIWFAAKQILTCRLLNLNKKLFILAYASTLILIACSNEAQKSGTPALFSSKAEAEAEAKNFNCTGAHKMGEKWMPCMSHQSHEKHHKHGDHD